LLEIIKTLVYAFSEASMEELMSPSIRRFVAYYRVSTARQGRSGLGLEAQKAAVLAFINGRAELVAEFTEVESGKHANREELKKAIAACKKHKAKLVIAKLDRLSRNLAFIATLMESGVEFVAVDMPEANKLTVHILAAMAEHEREQISKRTKDALAAAKRRGKRLGNHHRGDRAKRRNEPQRHRRQAQRAQCAHSARRNMDACAGRGDSAPFRRKHSRSRMKR
jgi:DNA invertase Pin-like site-specific DNA recombinase